MQTGERASGAVWGAGVGGWGGGGGIFTVMIRFGGESGNIFGHYLFISVMAVYLHISKNTVK